MHSVPHVSAPSLFIESWGWMEVVMVTLILTPGIIPVFQQWVGSPFLCWSGSLVITLPCVCGHRPHLLSFLVLLLASRRAELSCTLQGQGKARINQCHNSAVFLGRSQVSTTEGEASPGERQTSPPRSLCPLTSVHRAKILGQGS